MPQDISIPCDILHNDCNAAKEHCVVVGRVGRDILESTLAACPAGVLWLVDEAYSKGIHYNGLLAVPVESVSTDDFISVVTRFVFRISGALPGIKVSRSIEFLHSERYEVLGKQMKGLFLSAVSFMPTQRARGVPASFHRQDRVLRNLRKIANTLLPKDTRSALSGMPAVVLGAGPSLDVSLPWLNSFQDRCLIFATDSALGACARCGIVPDFAVNIDPDKSAQKTWPEELKVERLLLSLQSTEDWFERAKGSSWMLPMGSLTEHWVEGQGFDLGERIAASNAGFTALAVADFFGCTPLLLLGMDMAVDKESEGGTHSLHVSDTENAEDVASVRESAEVRYIAGNYKDEVPTIFYPFYKEMNAWLEKEDKAVVNINDRGAAFSNSTLVHPDEMSVWLDKHLPQTSLSKGSLFQQLNTLDSEKRVGDDGPFLSEVNAAAHRGLSLLEPFSSSPRDQDWAIAVTHSLRLAIQDEAMQGILGVYFMDRLASLVAHQLPSLGDVEQLFDETISLFQVASAC